MPISHAENDTRKGMLFQLEEEQLQKRASGYTDHGFRKIARDASKPKSSTTAENDRVRLVKHQRARALLAGCRKQLPARIR